MSQTQLLATTVCCFAALFGPDAFLARVPAADRAGLELFEKRIRPALVRYCYECHSAATRPLKGGLQLDSRDGIRTGGETGPAVVPGKVSDSLLIAAIRHESLEMPPDVKLPDALVAEFVKWIELGAPDPRDHPPSANKLAELSWQAVLDDRRDWWSLQPVRSPQVPLTADSSWSDHPVDRFVLSQLELAGLDPAGEAEPPLLLRRL